MHHVTTSSIDKDSIEALFVVVCKAFSFDTYDGRCVLYSEEGRMAYWFGHSCGYPGTSSTESGSA